MGKNRLVKQTRIALLIYIGAIFLAMPFYAGGTYAIKDVATSYNFFTNFLSDLGRSVSHSGDINFHSSFLFNNAMTIFGIFYARFIYYMPNYIGNTNKNIAFLAKIASIIACLCVIGVALTPANIRSLYALHILSANSIFYFGGFGSILFGYLFLKSKVIDNKYGWILILYGISTAIYIYILFFGPKPWESVYGLTVQASAQKAIFLIGFFTNWMTIKAIGLLDDKV
tara:strand:- start:509 stop:1189 length:681 start_codon:yes stop_codon:yes gene_type:complete